MKVERIVREELSFKPGEYVVVKRDGREYMGKIVRAVENSRQAYVVVRVMRRNASDYTAWFPISTYGTTWMKEDEV